MSDILQHPVPVVVVTAAQETAVIGKDCVFFIAGGPSPKRHSSNCRVPGFLVEVFRVASKVGFVSPVGEKGSRDSGVAQGGAGYGLGCLRMAEDCVHGVFKFRRQNVDGDQRLWRVERVFGAKVRWDSAFDRDEC